MSRRTKNNLPPYSVAEYLKALQLLMTQPSWGEPFLTILRWQVSSEKLRANASDLAQVMGISIEQINLIYGRAGKALGTLLTGQPSDQLKKGWPFLAHGEYEDGRFFWYLHESLYWAIKALELLSEQDKTPAYIAALGAMQQRGQLNELRLKMLQKHYAAPYSDLMGDEFAALMGWSSFATVNANYDQLGRFFAEFLGSCPATYDGTNKPIAVAYLVTFWHDGRGWHWVMRRGLQRALEQLKLVTPKRHEQVFTFEQASSLPASDPNAITELINTSHYFEGALKTVQVNVYERNLQARRKCIQTHGPVCKVCNVNLVDVYGPIAKDYIHVHHLRPLSEIGETYKIDPEQDLIPVCPNCHAMLHRNNPPMTVKELKARMLEAQALSYLAE